MAASGEKKYEEIVSRLAGEFSANNEDALKKDSSHTQQDFINRGLSNSTVKVSKLLELHYGYLNRLVDFLTGSLEKDYSQLRPTKCKKYLLKVVDSEYEKLKRKVPGWLLESQLLDEKVLAMFEEGVISKKEKAIEGLGNKCALWEKRWTQKRKWYRDPKWIITIIVTIILAVIGWFVQGNNGQLKSKPSQERLKVLTIDPNTGKTALNIRTEERVEELKEFIIKEKIDPWLFIKHPSFKVTKDDGSVIEYPNLEYAGSLRDVFLGKDYVDPFLSKGIKRILDETGQECRTNGLRAEEPLKEAGALLAGIIRNIYDRMAEVDSRLRKQRGDSGNVSKVNMDERVKTMDEKLREHLQAALELYSDPSQ